MTLKKVHSCTALTQRCLRVSDANFSCLGTLLLPVCCSALFTSGDFLRWRGGFYDRLKQHVAAASQSIGELCAQPSRQLHSLPWHALNMCH